MKKVFLLMRTLLPVLVLSLLFIFYVPFTASAQQGEKENKALRKQLGAVRITEPLKIDGVLNEAAWKDAEIATDFIQFRPVPGPKEAHKTEVRVLYDNEAIYIGATMHDVTPDSIFKQLSKRDEFGNSDFFGIFLDTYNDENNGFGFFTTPTGVQLDARYSSNGEDWSWNAVWENSASIDGNKWVAEFKIPYSALRFSSKQEQVWGINFMRQRQSTSKAFFWSPIDQNTNGFINQWGKLVGLKSIEAPLRLSFTPYVSAFAANYPQQQTGEGKTAYKNDFNFSGGMDVKYGINDAFTLDMTLIPDFSQVQSDNQVLNLSPFEVQFNENRPFFMEGTELFNKGGFFYSRRIGGRPVNSSRVRGEKYKDYKVIENPRETKMVNGTKVSGRTESGLGIGVFNAVVGNTYAILDSAGRRIEVETQPITNYNITVLDQSLRNNSSITLVNTNVMRAGSTYDANLTGVLFRLANKSNKYAINGKAALSQQFFSDDTKRGYMYRLGAGKVSGKFQYRASHTVESDTYNPNDLGILFTNNSVEENVHFQYNKLEPFWKFLNAYANIGAEYERRFKPDTFQDFVIYSNLRGTFKNFWNAGVWLNAKPVEGNDFFEPRVAGRHYVKPRSFGFGTWVSTDSRKKLAMEMEMNYRTFDENNRKRLGFSIEPRYQVSDQLTFRYSFNREFLVDDMGFAAAERDENGGVNRIIFGLRDVNTVSNTFSGSYIFNNKMSVSMRARHYWSKAEYNNFFNLTDAGRLAPDNYNGDHNINFNAFNVDMVYSWWFAPGSEISIVWKNSILDSRQDIVTHYHDNFTNTISSPQNNSLSVKVLYYIDYLTIKNKLFRS
jgi:hypothetical protein